MLFVGEHITSSPLRAGLGCFQGCSVGSLWTLGELFEIILLQPQMRLAHQAHVLASCNLNTLSTKVSARDILVG